MPPDEVMGAIDVAGRAIADTFAGHYRAVLLVGAAARGEITSVAGHVLSDLDFLVVLPQTSVAAAMLEMRRCRPHLQALHAQLPRSPFEQISVGFAYAAPKYWRMATPLMWELRTASRVLYGSSEVKTWPALHAACHIPRWEGIRLIGNRLCELFTVIGCGANAAGNVSSNLPIYACVKAVLACSEAALIDVGRYAPSYRERERQHVSVAQRFTSDQNDLIGEAYRVKAGQGEWLPPRSEGTLRPVLRLAIATLAQLGISDPVHFAARAMEQRHTAPGVACDALYWVTRALHLQRVPRRRAITDVYADAYRLAAAIIRDDAADARSLARCRHVAARYASCPQTVSIIPSVKR